MSPELLTGPHVSELNRATAAPATLGDGNSRPGSLPTPTKVRVPSAAAERPLRLDSPTSTRLPTQDRTPARPWNKWLFSALGLVVLAITGAAIGTNMTLLGDPYKGLNLEYGLVERGNLSFTVVEKGELEAAMNTDVICKVRAQSQNRNGPASSIKWLVDDGTQVKKGDVVIRLEDTAVKDQVETQKIIVTEKRALLIEAEKEKQIVESQNQIGLKTARNNLEIAKLDSKKYIEGDLRQRRQDVQGRLLLAKAALAQWEDRVGWSLRMVKKGFMSENQAQADRDSLKSAELTLQKFQEEERVLENYESARNELDWKNKVEQAEVALKVAQTQGEAILAKVEANLKARHSILGQEENRLEQLEEDVLNCTITAPQDGMVVYYIPEQSKSDSGSQQSIIAVGEPVREGQKLMRIPNFKEMQVKLKIHESLAPRLRPEQKAQIKVSSQDRPLMGHVKSIGAVASLIDAKYSDVRVNDAIVTMEESDETLTPGMSAEVTILVDQRDDVLMLPVHAVLEVAGEKFCYVKHGKKIEQQVLETGLNNNRFIEIKQGLTDGDSVVQNARTLAEKRGDLTARPKEKSEVAQKPGKPTRPADGARDS